MIAVGESGIVVSGVAWLRRVRAWRWAPLLTVLALALITQAALVLVHPAIPNAPDSREYLATAAKIAHTGQLVDPRRTPGYPSFLALIFFVFGGRNLSAVVVIQCALFFVTTAEVYLLTYRFTQRAWVACLATAPAALNLYMLDWAYSIRDEAFSYWLVVTLFVMTERLTRRLRPTTVAAFIVLSALLVLTRPFFVFLPALIIVALAARGIALRQQARAHALALVVSLALIYGCVAGYMALNKAENGYFGISYISDVNLFGKVIEYHMQASPVPAALQSLQRRVGVFTARGGWQPWDFARDYGYEGDYYAQLGAFAKYIILHHPAQYAAHTLVDMAHVWLQKPGLDAQGGKPLLFSASRLIARGGLMSYLALPLALLWLLLLLRKGWRDPAIFMVALLALAVVATIGMTATASYSEFYRLRTPIDWAYLVVFMLVALDVGGAALQRLGGRARHA